MKKEKTEFLDSADRKLIKSFFSIEATLRDFRAISPETLALLSLENLYDLIIDSIDLVRFVRRNQVTTTKFQSLNKGLKAVTPNENNTGGLIQINVKSNPIVPFFRTERNNLQFLQEEFILMKKNLLSEENALTKLPVVLVKNTKTIMVGSDSKETKRKNSKKKNRHFTRLRAKRRKF